MLNDDEWYEKCVICNAFLTNEECRGHDYPLYCEDHKHYNNFTRFEMMDLEESEVFSVETVLRTIETNRFELVDFDD